MRCEMDERFMSMCVFCFILFCEFCAWLIRNFKFTLDRFLIVLNMALIHKTKK